MLTQAALDDLREMQAFRFQLSGQFVGDIDGHLHQGEPALLRSRGQTLVKRLIGDSTSTPPGIHITRGNATS